MPKELPKIPVSLLLVLSILILGIFLSQKMSESKDAGSLNKMEQKNLQKEKDILETRT